MQSVTEPTAEDRGVSAASLVRQATDSESGSGWLGQFLCGLVGGGHTYLMLYQKDRLALKCVSCGKETPGWRIH